MNRVEPIIDVTLEMKKILDVRITSTNREAVLAELDELIDNRGELMTALVPPYSNEEMEAGKSLVHVNNDIQMKMESIFNELKAEMRQVHKQKRSNQSYTNPYINIQTMDGMFMDSKK